MTKQEFFSIENVMTFKGFSIVNGEVSVYDHQYEEYLDDVYGVIQVCGMSYSTGSVLSAVDPVAFRCGKGDYESQLQSELEEQLDNEDSSDIEFHEGDEDDLTDEEDE